MSFTLLKLNQLSAITRQLLFDQSCIICQQSFPAWRAGNYPMQQPLTNQICFECWHKLPFLLPPLAQKNLCQNCSVPLTDDVTGKIQSICFTCQTRPIACDRIFALCRYQPPISDLILQLKYSDDLSKANFFATILKICQPTIFSQLKKLSQSTTTYLLPVPSHYLRLWQRRYNPAEVLARAIAKEWCIPINTQVLKRISPTTQKGLGQELRFRQLSRAFRIRTKAWKKFQQQKPQQIILVDDVVTTCATMHHLAKLLKKHGIQKVYGIAIARAVL